MRISLYSLEKATSGNRRVKMDEQLPLIIKRERKYFGEIFSVYRYEIQLEDKTITRDIIERKHGVAIVPIDRDQNVLLIQEYYGGSNSFLYSLPGGSIEEGCESIEKEAMRELREETGYRALRMIKLHYAFSHPAISNRRSYTFLGYDLILDPLPKRDEDELIKVLKLPLEDAIQGIYKDFESDMSTIGNLLMARDKLKELNL